MKLVTRAQWGARPYRMPGGATRYAGPRRGVKIHYLGTPYTDRPHTACAAYVRKIQDQHMDGNGWSDIGYSFLVCTHGYVYEGRGLERRNSANGNTALNEQDYAVCALLGSSGLTVPPDAQVNGLRDAIEYCREEGPAGTWLGGHRDGYATSCPGDALYIWVHAGAPRPNTTPIEEDDMTPDESRMLKEMYDGRRVLPWTYKGTDEPLDAYAYLRGTSAKVDALASKVTALETASLTDAQVAAVADKVAASPTLAEKIAELVADKLAARLAQ